MPKQYNKLLFKFATAVHSVYLDAPLPDFPVTFPEGESGYVKRLQRLLRKAERHGNRNVTLQLRDGLRVALRNLCGQLTVLSEQIDQVSKCQPVPSLRDIYQDLIALEQEFTEVEFRRATLSISVFTRPITLDGVSLGRFEIQLDCHHVQRWAAPYRVISRDGRTSASNSDVSHPHVLDERLCEGEGEPVIRSALKQGRLLDFFQVVENVLQTYNDESAYVRLENWDELICDDCGEVTPKSEMAGCSSCERQICEECYDACEECLNALCANCGGRCKTCECLTCDHCLETCPSCKESHCKSCLSERSVCEACENKTDEESDNPEPEQTDPQVEIQSHSMGKAAVLS
jgi:hypothetical protein